MGFYIYQNPITLEIKEIFQKMSEPHTYSENGIEYKRIFTIPNAMIGSIIDPFNSKRFVEKTGKNKDTLASLWDRSKELSEKRKNKLGYDPVEKKSYENYKKIRKGKEHPNIKFQKAKEQLAKKGVELTD